MNYSVQGFMIGDDSAQCVPNRRLNESEQIALAGSAAGHSRETVLLSCMGLLLLLIGVTAFASRMYHKNIHVLADQWFANGEAAFRAGDPAEAAKDYRNALVYSEGNTVFQFHLAQALTAAHKDEEAQSYLLNLLAESPGSGEINLELARISARKTTKTSVQDALRYYNGAIYGVWDQDPLPERWDARRELCEYLLSRGMTTQAQPEALALAQDVPLDDLAREKQAAAMLTGAGLWDRALNEYRSILASHKRDPDALAGAGLAAFQLQQYARAVQYLNELPRSRRVESEISTRLALAREVEVSSPFLSSLSSRERARRAAEAVARGKTLAQACSQQQGSATNAALQKLQDALKQNSRKWTTSNFVRHPDQIDTAMKWVFDVEGAAAQACGQSQNLADHALLLIAKSRTSPDA
jgi:hypothetical protein